MEASSLSITPRKGAWLVFPTPTLRTHSVGRESELFIACVSVYSKPLANLTLKAFGTRKPDKRTSS